MNNLPSQPLRVADLPTKKPTRFELVPEQAALRAIAEELGLQGLRKLRFKGEISADGKRDWRLTAQLGATVTQPCVVTLGPVTTRIEEPVERRFVAEIPDFGPSAKKSDEDEEGIEMPEDDNTELLDSHIDPGAVMLEALSLALPLYPRAEDAALEETNFTEPGKDAMTDEDTKPFAGLAALREQLGKKDGE